MRRRLFPGDHEDVADSYNNLGVVYSDMNDYNDAMNITN